MHRRNLISIILAIVLMMSVTPAIAQQSGEQYVVQPGDTLYDIAIRFGTSIRAIVDANELTNPDLIFAGDTLIIPTFRTSSNPAPAAPAPAAPAPASSAPTAGTGSSAPGATGELISPPAGSPGTSGAWALEVGTPIYAGDGYVVDIPITIHNTGVTPAIAGGKYTATLKPDGNYEDAALMKSQHGDFEQPLVGNALMWQAVVHMSDGSSHFMTVGCEFIEHVFAEGWEPLKRDKEGNWLEVFYYQINLYDGWFDCGNTLRINPPNIEPGTSGSSVLKVYFINPHKRTYGEISGSPYPNRWVTQVDVTVFRQDGSLVGTQSAPVAVP